MTARLALLLALPMPALAAPIQVAVLDGENSNGSYDDLRAQLEDDTWVEIDATLLTGSTLKASDLTAYDVVVFGDSGYASDSIFGANVADALAAFQARGGGVVASSWASYSDPNDNLDPHIPVDQSAKTDGYCAGPTTVTRVVEHPVMDGVASYVDTSTYTETPGPPDAGAVAVGTANCNDAPAVIVRDGATDRGRQVYLGGIYAGASTYNNANLRTGDADRVLEQAVAWASGLCDDVDQDGVSACAGDCDDDDDARFPGNAEICDGIDNDCDSVVPSDEVDADDDGVLVCEDDCDDTDPDRYPGNAEICDGIDNDCNTDVDDGLSFSDWWPDADGDGYGSGTPVSACDEVAGHANTDGDCDDANAAVSPAATEIADNDIDEDCDGEDFSEGGCGCQSGPQGGLLGILFLPALVLLRRRRR